MLRTLRDTRFPTVQREDSYRLVSSRASNIAFTEMEASVERYGLTKKRFLRGVCLDTDRNVVLWVQDRRSIVEDSPSLTSRISLLVAGITEWIIGTETLTKRMDPQRIVVDCDSEFDRLNLSDSRGLPRLNAIIVPRGEGGM